MRLLALAALISWRTAAAAPYCQGEYAEDLSALSADARALEARTPAYSYAVRTTASYECVSYNESGELERTRVETRAHGTAFGLRYDGKDTLLATNEHVAAWPAVSSDAHPVPGVPSGCKRVADSLFIVDDQHDEYAADDVPLERVVVDPALDVAVLRAHQKLPIMPWAIGKSAALQARDAVMVKGFPLGEFRATNVGKVISPYDHDRFGDWNHDDFVVDALLTSGGSGSPVLAVSCKTGQLELVGIFHAHYSAASALNVVVQIDQTKELLATLKRKPVQPKPALDGAARAHLVAAVTADPDAPFFAVGSLIASVHARSDGSLVFAVFGADFPRSVAPLVVVEDLPGTDAASFGVDGAVFVGGRAGLQLATAGALDADAQAQIAKLLGVLRGDAIAAFDYRADARAIAGSRAEVDGVSAKRRALKKLLDGQHDVAATVAAIATKAATAVGQGAVVQSLAAVEAGGPPPAGTLAKD